jgi:elongation factor P
MELINSQKIRKGDVYRENGAVFLVMSYTHNKRGRGQATIRLKVRNIDSSAITDKTYSNKERLELVDLRKRSAQFLYADNSSVHFMDSEDYSQFTIKEDAFGDDLLLLKEGEKVVVLWLDGYPINIEVPSVVELEITETENAVAGNTSSGATKRVTLQTGLEIEGPLFLKIGDTVKINTDSLTYVSKV